MNAKTKTVVKRAVKGIAGTLGTLLPRTQNASRILTYHSVGYRDHEMNVCPDAFRQQMGWLAQNVNVLPLAEAARGQPGVAVTFDDGYLDNLTEAAPILSECRVPATVFVVAGKTGGFLDHDIHAESARLMTWDQIRKLETMGIAIGAHTLSHARLSTLPESRQREEIAGCAQLMAERLNHPIEAFAYPFGSAADYDERCKELAREAGFAYACSNRYGTNVAGQADLWALRRIWIDATDSLQTFQRKVLGQLDLLCLLETLPALLARRLLNQIARG